jgi:tetratricopeptide (TPR) repeat protein
MQKLKSEAEHSFSKAAELNPKRQGIYQEWLKTSLLSEDYKRAEQKAQKCIELDENYPTCYWLMTLIKGYLRDKEGFEKFYSLSLEKGFNPDTKEPLQQLINMYIKTGDYLELAETMPKLIEITEDRNQKAQIYASLAVVYKELGQKEKAREAALKALELQPGAKEMVDEFLKSLPR